MKSTSKIKAHPIKNPTAAGKKENSPNPSDCSIAGKISDHIDAANIIPADSPVMRADVLSFTSFLNKNTANAPRLVIANIKQNPKITCPISLMLSSFVLNCYYHYMKKKVNGDKD